MATLVRMFRGTDACGSAGVVYPLVLTLLVAVGCSSTEPSRFGPSPTAPTLPSTSSDAVSRLSLVSFTMIEYQYPAVSNRWFYAPQIEVEEVTGGATATITSAAFTIPGFGSIPPDVTRKCVEAGQRVQLFPESYGDFAFSIDNSTVGRASPGEATVVITFSDASGGVGTVSGTAAIVSGRLPSTYSGGRRAVCAGG